MIHLHWHFFLTLIQLFSHDYFLFTQSIYFQMVFTQFIYLFFLNDSYLTCDFPPPPTHNSFLFTYRFVRFQMQFWKKNVRFIFIYLHNSFLFTCELLLFFLHNSSYLFIHISDTWYYFSHIIQSCHVLRFYGNFRP